MHTWEVWGEITRLFLQVMEFVANLKEIRNQGTILQLYEG